MSGQGPPPPPPAPGPGGPPLPPSRLPPPPPGFRVGPTPDPRQFQLPIRQPINSTRVVDITPRRPMDDDSCRKKLTSYEVYTIRKIVPDDPKVKATWAKSKVTKETLSQEDIFKALNRLEKTKQTVLDKKADLMPFQQGQIDRLTDELKTTEHDPNFEWALSQIDRKQFKNKKGQRETTSLTVYVKRAPLKDLNPVGLFNALERNKMERLAQMNRPLPPPQPPAGGAPAQGVVNLGPVKEPRRPSKSPVRIKKDRHDNSSFSGFSSDTESTSEGEYSSSENTTISSTPSKRHSKKYHHKVRGQSPHKAHKKYYISEQVYSPGYRDSIPRHIPDVPHGLAAVPAFNPVAAAYQARKFDAGVERFGQDRYPPRISVPVVSYGAQRYPEPLYEEARYIDDLRREDNLRREEMRQRDAEEYMDRRANEYRIVEPRIVEPRIVYTNANPFAPMPIPRRYVSSQSSAELGW